MLKSGQCLRGDDAQPVAVEAQAAQLRCRLESVVVHSPDLVAAHLSGSTRPVTVKHTHTQKNGKACTGWHTQL